MHRVAEINIALWVRALMPALDGIVSRICSSARHHRHETEMKTLGRELEAMGTSGALHHEEMATYVWGTRRRNGPATRTPPMSPLAEAWAWQLSAGCRGADSSTFSTPTVNAGSSGSGANERPNGSVPSAPSSGSASTTHWSFRNRTASGADSPKTNDTRFSGTRNGAAVGLITTTRTVMHQTREFATASLAIGRVGRSHTGLLSTLQRAAAPLAR